MPGRFGGLILLGLILGMNLFACGCVIWMELLMTEISRQVHRKCSRAGLRCEESSASLAVLSGRRHPSPPRLLPLRQGPSGTPRRHQYDGGQRR